MQGDTAYVGKQCLWERRSGPCHTRHPQWHGRFEMCHETGITTVDPTDKVHVATVAAGYPQEVVRPKIIGHHDAAAQRSIVGIALLFNMCRHKKQRLPEIHGLTDRLETGCRSIGRTTTERAEKGTVIDGVERERRIDALCSTVATAVAEK